MLFGIGQKKITYEEFNSTYRPLLIDIARDCMAKAKSMYKNPNYKKIEDPKYIAKDHNINIVDVEEGILETYIFKDNYYEIMIVVIDGSQDARTTLAAAKFLGEIREYLNNKWKAKLVDKNGKQLITIETGDGDEGCVYITFDYKLLGFKTKDIKYKSLSESDLISRLNNLKFI